MGRCRFMVHGSFILGKHPILMWLEIHFLTIGDIKKCSSVISSCAMASRIRFFPNRDSFGVSDQLKVRCSFRWFRCRTTTFGCWGYFPLANLLLDDTGNMWIFFHWIQWMEALCPPQSGAQKRKGMSPSSPVTRRFIVALHIFIAVSETIFDVSVALARSCYTCLPDLFANFGLHITSYY